MNKNEVIKNFRFLCLLQQFYVKLVLVLNIQLSSDLQRQVQNHLKQAKVRKDRLSVPTCSKEPKHHSLPRQPNKLEMFKALLLAHVIDITQMKAFYKLFKSKSW